jgi:hypothetical protein
MYVAPARGNRTPIWYVAELWLNSYSNLVSFMLCSMQALRGTGMVASIVMSGVAALVAVFAAAMWNDTGRR